jgi:hypothetical protein
MFSLSRTALIGLLVFVLASAAFAQSRLKVEASSGSQITLKVFRLTPSRERAARIYEGDVLGAREAFLPCVTLHQAASLRLEAWADDGTPVMVWPQPGKGQDFWTAPTGETCLGDDPREPRFATTDIPGENGLRIVLAADPDRVTAGVSFRNLAALVTSPTGDSGAVAPQTSSVPVSVPTLLTCRTSSARVVNGTTAHAGQYPWIVSLREPGDTGDTHNCGGALISPRHVLTAGHCVSSTLKQVRLGGIQRDRGQLVAIRQAYLHPRYRVIQSEIGQVPEHDVAVLELAEALPDHPQLTLADAQSEAHTVNVHTCADGMGWGQLGEKGELPELLQTVQVPIWSQHHCRTAYPFTTAKQLCAGYAEGMKDTCNGDSGGPLVVPARAAGETRLRWLQMGIVSFGKGCAQANKPGVYARVAAYRPWIDCIVSRQPKAVCDQRVE